MATPVQPRSDPTEIAVFILKGTYKEKDVPMGKMETGKKVLFREDYHPYLKYGEVWICRITDDYPTYCFAYPLQKVSGIGGENQWKPMSPLVAQLFIEKLTDEIAQKEAELKAMQIKKKEFTAKFEEVKKKYHDMEEFLDNCDEKVRSLSTDVKVLQEALDYYTPQTVDVGTQGEVSVGPDDLEEDDGEDGTSES